MYIELTRSRFWKLKPDATVSYADLRRLFPLIGKSRDAICLHRDNLNPLVREGLSLFARIYSVETGWVQIKKVKPFLELLYNRELFKTPNVRVIRKSPDGTVSPECIITMYRPYNGSRISFSRKGIKR